MSVKMASIVRGIGVNHHNRPTRIDGKKIAQYRHWSNMLNRVSSEKLHFDHPTYIGCSVSDNFKNYSFFYDWCEDQVGFGVDGNQLDKDIIFKGNLLYSEETCFFVPKRINTLILNRQMDRGNLPIGVTFNNQKMMYQARISDGSKRINVGFFKNPISAFFAYKQAKESFIKKYAEEYRGSIDSRVYNALVSYSVDIND